MKTTHAILLMLTPFLAASLFAAEGGPGDEIKAASKKLAGQDNYSWTTTVVVPEEARFRPGPTHGKTEKNGATLIDMSFGDNTTRAVIQGEKAAVTNMDGEWESVAELENSEGRGRFRAFMVRSILKPADQVVELAGAVKELKKDGDSYAGDLTEAGAKKLMAFRRRGGDGEGPNISSAKGSVKIWIKGGDLVKYEYKVQGVMEWNGNDIDVDRTTTVEIKDVGKTKVEVPEAAKKKLS